MFSSKPPATESARADERRPAAELASNAAVLPQQQWRTGIAGDSRQVKHLYSLQSVADRSPGNQRLSALTQRMMRAPASVAPAGPANVPGAGTTVAANQAVAPAAAAAATMSYEQFREAMRTSNRAAGETLANRYPDYNDRYQGENNREGADREAARVARVDAERKLLQAQFSSAGLDRVDWQDETRRSDNVRDAYFAVTIGGVPVRVHVRFNGQGDIAFATAGEHGGGRLHIRDRRAIGLIRRQLVDDGHIGPAGGSGNARRRISRSRSRSRSQERRRSRSAGHGRSDRQAASDVFDQRRGRTRGRSRSRSPDGGASRRAAAASGASVRRDARPVTRPPSLSRSRSRDRGSHATGTARGRRDHAPARRSRSRSLGRSHGESDGSSLRLRDRGSSRRSRSRSRDARGYR